MLKPKKNIQNTQKYLVPFFKQDCMYKLNSNENILGPSKKVIEAIKNVNSQEFNYYSFYGEITCKIAEFENVEPETIKVTDGADDALSGIIQTYMEPDDILLTLSPSFEMPSIYATIAGGKVKKVPYKTKWQFPLNDFLKALLDKKVKVIYLAVPANPTGDVIEPDIMQKILDCSHDKVVIIDETYGRYWGLTYKNLVNTYDNVFIVHSFSKDFALAGVRLGYIISNPENIKNVSGVVPPYSVSSLAVVSGLAALSDIDYLKKVLNEININKIQLKEFFETLGLIVYDSAANFLLIDCGLKVNFIYNKLLNSGIIVKKFTDNDILQNHLRVTIPDKKGVMSIINALKIKPTLAFDMDGVLIDASKSYRIAIQKTYEYFSHKQISQERIQQAKNLGGMNNDWDLTSYLLHEDKFYINYDDIVYKFQEFYWNNGNGLINNEELLITKEYLKKLSNKYNLAIFTGRLKNEALFALEKFNISDMFFPLITTDDIPDKMGKPNPYGLQLLISSIITNKVYYFGDTIDDIKCAVDAKAIPVGVLPPQDKSDILHSKMAEVGAKSVLSSLFEIDRFMEIENENI